MNELSLFTGAGGGLLGTKLLGWRHIGYVEINEYCQRIIAQRIADGYLDEAPIFTDIREFIQSGAAEQYRGFADVVTAGFPCQSFSTASRGRGNAGRDLWPETLRVIYIVRPQFVLAENVHDGATHRAKLDLEATGYQVRRARISAASLGAPHRRPREWLVANTDSDGESHDTEYAEVAGVCRVPRLAWWDEDKSVDLGMDNGLPNRMDRARAIGNAQIPQVAATAWELLTGEQT